MSSKLSFTAVTQQKKRVKVPNNKFSAILREFFLPKNFILEISCFDYRTRH